MTTSTWYPQKSAAQGRAFQSRDRQHDLLYYLDPNALLHVEANACLVQEMAERRCIIARATEQARMVFDLSISLPNPPKLLKSHWTLEELVAAEFPAPKGPIPGLVPPA